MNFEIEKFVAPIQELNALYVDNVEKLAGIQLEALEESVNAGVDSLKKASSVKDIEGAKSYFVGQSEAAKVAVENAVARGKSVAEIVQAYPASVKKILDSALAA